MRKQGIDGTGMLNLYDRVTGIFNEIFDSRLLTAAIFALIGYCSLFTQRKFPMRWMIFVLFGMILLAFVTLTARTPGQKTRVHFHKGMAGLWFALHGMMVVSGLFYEDWLPESVPLLICYPIVFSVFVSRDDDSTFRSILRGAVFAVLPFLAWSYAAVPLSFAYPGYKGVFYDANCLSMCCIVMATAALLLAGSAQALFGLGKSKTDAPAPENAPAARDLEIRTYRGIPCLGQLEAADPDGGELTFAIVTQPKKGTVTVEGANFTYTPKENAAGGDSFTYSAANSAGAVSLPATVTVTIEKTRSGVTYADTGEATATAAQDLAERGVFTGAKIGDKWYFEPDRTVSRGEFLAMVLETAGAEVTDVTMTGFRDDDAIPTWAKSYAAAGVAEGILRGKLTEDGAVFSCEDPISFSEAATVLNRVLDLGDVELEVWFADREAAPSWAAQAVGNMEALNVLSVGSFGSDRLETAVTRADAARMLSAAGTLLRGEKDTGLLGLLKKS